MQLVTPIHLLRTQPLTIALPLFFASQGGVMSGDNIDYDAFFVSLTK